MIPRGLVSRRFKAAFSGDFGRFFPDRKVFVDNRGEDTVKYKSCRRKRRETLLLLQARGLMSSIKPIYMMEV